MTRLEYLQEIAKETLDLKGDMAEAGVYKGDTAEALCQVKGEKTLYLFDTFTGLPESMFTPVDVESSFNKSYIYPNAYEHPLEEVQKRLSEYAGVEYRKGLIPKTFKGLWTKKYCFIHIDLDLYKSTLEALKYFLPRRVKGGIIMIHNYPDFRGVRLAVEKMKVKNVEEGYHKYCLI